VVCLARQILARSFSHLPVASQSHSRSPPVVSGPVWCPCAHVPRNSLVLTFPSCVAVAWPVTSSRVGGPCGAHVPRNSLVLTSPSCVAVALPVTSSRVGARVVPMCPCLSGPPFSHLPVASQSHCPLTSSRVVGRCRCSKILHMREDVSTHSEIRAFGAPDALYAPRPTSGFVTMVRPVTVDDDD
jgi:hypothetical protein